MTARIY